ncbi:class I SAM-dependent methyltransferase [Actinophytocola sp. NPDC049390]|uniref:class I SAM-dependent methyltransferase n=1 Tax=Actinophytocola sp. NPDC049390 TaxID=3363894 RepID=UPI00378A85E7
MSTTAEYVFGTAGDAVRTQQRLLADAYDEVTRTRLIRTGVGAGWHCLDVGTGGGTVAAWLADRVGPAGSVLATDLTRPAAARGVTPLPHDITRDPLPDNAFDLIVARLVLRHLPARDDVLGRLVRALKPGGLLQIDEFDTGCQPCLVAPSASGRLLYQRFLRARDAVMAAAGVEGTYGRRVAEAMSAAGLVAVDAVPVVTLWRPGAPGLALLAHTTHQLRAELLAAGMTARDLTRVRALLAHPDFRASSSVLYSVQGRRP